MPDSPVDELLDRLGRRPRPEPTPLADIAERARRIRRRRRTHAKAAAASVAVIGSLIVALLLVTVGQPSPTKVTVGATTTVSPPGTARPPVVAVDHLAPLADTALTPAGWSPLSLGAIQISVPSSWTIDSPQEEICPTGTDGPLAERRDDGVVFVSQTPYLGACPLPATVIKLASQSPTALLHAHSAVINSLPVSEGTTTSAGVSTQVVRTGGMQLDLLGPLAARVLATLTHSPLSVVLNSTVSTVPAGWRQLDFEGLRFDVPSQWRVDRLSVGQCPGNIAANAVTLDTEQVPQTSSCGGGPPLPTAGVLAASPGTVVTGPQGAAPSNATCLRRNGLRICVDPAPPSGGGFVAGFALNLLTAQVTVPGRTGADQIEIGLTGSGVTPLEILDSMRPAP